MAIFDGKLCRDNRLWGVLLLFKFQQVRRSSFYSSSPISQNVVALPTAARTGSKKPVDSGVTNRPTRIKLAARTDDPKHLANSQVIPDRRM